MAEAVLTKVIRCMTIDKLQMVEEYEYSLEKDSWLIAERGIGFED